MNQLILLVLGTCIVMFILWLITQFLDQENVTFTDKILLAAGFNNCKHNCFALAALWGWFGMSKYLMSNVN